ncbi:hypothetical protein CIG75_18525 [Tumebacillus algifaecis]|uniref:Radical SAM core domain-containing protein n=1 Tax=Tumebacillus algifaecis TaxID=1214604 RepID=A0A223D5P9_9BACL|nr:radical SAM protein [Tumebacillus algifaecis]ASS76736.1 hypothetical protein CIG75_18525 [Tumebacillus algifaecis]
MSTLLLYPPITDPTSGYHSLIYLETYARQQGFQEIDIIDTNIEAFLYTMTPNQIEQIKQHIRMRREQLESQVNLDAAEQMELLHLWKSEHFNFDSLQTAVATLRDERAFYDYFQYRPAAELLSNWLNVLSVLGYPGQFAGFSLSIRSQFNLMSSNDMSDHEITKRVTQPFVPYYQEILFPHIRDKGYKTIGINVTYCAQLPFALALGRMIRAEFPETIILYGGTEVADVWKYLTHKSEFFTIFDVADACVVGEGESAFTSLLRMVEEGGNFSPLANTLFHPKHELAAPEELIVYQPIHDLPTPDYSKLNWDLYLSPHPYVYYSPSRGCYWNKCTFCDYGLNFDSPTSPWRQTPLDKIVEDLRVLSRQYKHIYFSVDVLAPALLLKLAERLLEEKIEIRWGAEIRLEEYWSPERCKLLKASGCTDISVGFESGNQRILNLINKGTQVMKIQETIQNFYDANIGVQVMGFTGFPTETLEDGLESVQFLHEHIEKWTFGGLGTFVLTPGAIVAKEPARFDLHNVGPYQGEDIVRQLHFENPSGQSLADQDTLNEAKKKLVKNHFDRPWVGGIDTGHTMFYHDRYGTEIVRVLHEGDHTASVEEVYTLNGMIAEDIPHFPVEFLFSGGNLDDLHHVSTNKQKGLMHHEIQALLRERTLQRADSVTELRRYFIKNDGTPFPFPEAMIDFLTHFSSHRSLSDLLPQLPEELREVYRELWAHSVEHHFIRPLTQYDQQPIPTTHELTTS